MMHHYACYSSSANLHVVKDDHKLIDWHATSLFVLYFKLLKNLTSELVGTYCQIDMPVYFFDNVEGVFNMILLLSKAIIWCWTMIRFEIRIRRWIRITWYRYRMFAASHSKQTALWMTLFQGPARRRPLPLAVSRFCVTSIPVERDAGRALLDQLSRPNSLQFPGPETFEFRVARTCRFARRHRLRKTVTVDTIVNHYWDYYHLISRHDME